MNLFQTPLFRDIANVDKRSFGYKTGFNLFDSLTASIEYIEKGLILPNCGFYARMYTFVGESGCGKTTSIIQFVCSLVDRYVGANCLFVDPEKNCGENRIKSLAKWDERHYNEKCIYIPPEPGGTSILDILNLIRRVGHAKLGMKKKYPLRYRDKFTGKPLYKLPVTVMVVDSIPALVLALTKEEEVDPNKEFKTLDKVSSNIDAAREAKDNTNFCKVVKSMLEEFNIVLIMINHITKEMSTGMFDRPKKYHPNLKAGERIKGGNEMIYQSFGFVRYHIKEMLNERNQPYGEFIDGNIGELEFVKNKASTSGGGYRYVFDKVRGIIPELSDYEFLHANKVGITGSPARLTLKILPEITFTRKTLMKKCRTKPILARALSLTAEYYLLNKRLLGEEKFQSDIKLNEIGTLPYEERVALILQLSEVYPCYNGVYTKDAVSEAYSTAIRGEIINGCRFDDQISVANLDRVAREMVIWSNPDSITQYAYSSRSFYDPLSLDKPSRAQEIANKMDNPFKFRK